MTNLTQDIQRTWVGVRRGLLQNYSNFQRAINP